MNRSPDQLAELLFRCCHKQKVSYDGKIVRFKCENHDRKLIEEEIKHFGITATFYPGNECEFEINRRYDNNTVIFFDEKALLNKIEDYRSEFDEMVLVIVDFQGNYLIKHKGEHFSEDKAIFFNSIQYRELIDFISSSTDFISFHDENEHRILVISGDSGPFFIGYNRNEPKIKSLPDLVPLKASLKTSFSKIDCEFLHMLTHHSCLC